MAELTATMLLISASGKAMSHIACTYADGSVFYKEAAVICRQSRD